jgi:hypothetical protein
MPRLQRSECTPFIDNISTSNTSQEFPGMTGGNPFAPERENESVFKIGINSDKYHKPCEVE